MMHSSFSVNFRAKPDTRFAHWPEPEASEVARSAAAARMILGDVNLQIPPNLTLECVWVLP